MRKLHSRTTKIIIITTAFALFGLAIVSYLVYRVGQKGTTVLEQWIGEQLQAIVSTYLNPELFFDELDYQYPRTVIFQNLRLSAYHPNGTGQPVDILTANRLTLELTKIPSRGQPLHIEKLILEQPQMRAIAVEAGSKKIIGFSNLFKLTSRDEIEQQRDEVRLSEVFQIRLIQIKDGLILYDPGHPNEPPMQLDNINAHLDIDLEKHGWYWFSAKLNQPIFSLGIIGKLDLDHFLLDLDELKLDMLLNREQDRYLPPQIQQFLIKHEVTADLTLTARGLLPIFDLQKANLHVNGELKNANVSIGQYRLPIAKLVVDTEISGGQVKVKGLEAWTLDGQINACGSMGLDGEMPLEITVEVQRLKIEKTLRQVGGEDRPIRYSGLLQGQIELHYPGKSIAQQTSGHGNLKLTKGNIMRLPFISDIVQLLVKVGQITGISHIKPRGLDRVEVQFIFNDDHINLTSINADMFPVVPIALRGKGKIYFDGRLDLRVNAGPLEKIQKLLGPIGKIMGKLTDQLIAYHITGTIRKPKISTKLLSFGDNVKLLSRSTKIEKIERTGM